MSTNKINQANINANQQLNNFKKVDSDKSTKTGNDSSVKSGIDQARIASEKLDISSKAHNLQKLKEIMESGRAALAEEPPIREDKVAEVRQKLADGFYQSADVKAEVAAELSSLMSRMDKLLK
ncbi:MAG: flagellar biosynthesis anti-sigma factor FlgM [bacterium]|nr:flagellar biosynthesis anti-sigma factor FlgM [bacterium]MCP4800715.1 flagellar biosynthesis anti-sigma factor FlgM [bacterium]